MGKMPSTVGMRDDKWTDSFTEEIKTRLRQVAFGKQEELVGVIVSDVSLTKNIDGKRITVKISREEEGDSK